VSSIDFLKRLLDTPGPSGFEAPAARVWREEAERFADRVDVDVSGNSYATIGEGGAPRVMLAGHVDEIGLMVTHVDDDGFLYFDGIGGWDPQVLVGQRIRVLTRRGEVMGVVGKKPIHLIKGRSGRRRRRSRISGSTWGFGAGTRYWSEGSVSATPRWWMRVWSSWAVT